MTVRALDTIELGRRAVLYLHVENELPVGARIVALAARHFFSSQDQSGDLS